MLSKSKIVLLIIFTLISCKPAELRIHNYSYTDFWYYSGGDRYQVYQNYLGNKYILVLNKQQTKFIRKYIK
jgi:hypothetical protein